MQPGTKRVAEKLKKMASQTSQNQNLYIATAEANLCVGLVSAKPQSAVYYPDTFNKD
jgi:hypothetical protein